MKNNNLFLVLLSIFMFMTQHTNSQVNSKELTILMEKACKKFHVPAIAVVISNSDRILLSEIQGFIRINSTNAASINDYFHIGSCSKSVLATLAGKFIEQGQLKWDTKLFELFPELKESSNPDYYNVTLEDLFLCKAGIKAFTSGNEPFPEIDSLSENKRLEFGKWLLKQPVSSKKTSDGKFEHLYSNASYTLISLILEKVSGKTYEDLIHDLLKKDLELDYIFGWPNDYQINQPWGHSHFSINDKGEVTNSKDNLVSFKPGNIYKLNDLIKPAGDMSMKPVDFAKYTQLHLKGLRGIDGYLKANTIKYIDLAHKGFSLGVYNGKSMGKEFAGFDGSAGTFYCRGFIVPKDDIALTIIINSGNDKAVDWLMLKIFKKQYNWWWKVWM